MNDPTAVALVFAGGLGLFGLGAVGTQVRGLRRLANRRHVPSDERAYLRGRYRRRLVSGGVILTVAALIAGAYLSGMEARANELARPAAADGGPEKPPMSPEDRQFVRLWLMYWIGAVLLVLGLVGLALMDVLAGRRYWLTQYRHIKAEHQEKLRRDLVMYQVQKQGRGRLGRLDE